MFPKRIFSLITAGLAFCCIMQAGTPESFELFEDFDNSSHFTASQTVPDGWLSQGTLPFKRKLTKDYGVAALSGDYAMVADNSTAFTRDDVLFTPIVTLAGGKPCTLTFNVWGKASQYPEVKNLGLNVRAGHTQSLEAHDIEVGNVPAAAYGEWTEFTFTFTPEADGDYCFSLAIDATANPHLNMKGNFMIDDVCINGWKPGEGDDPDVDLEPNPDNEALAEELPYFNTFDNLDGDYDGTSYLPRHWLSTGTMPFVTGNINELEAVTETWYLVSEQSTMARDERLYSPFFILEAGKEYDISYYLYMPGNYAYTDLTLTAGYEQDADFQPFTLQQVSGRSITAWELQEAKFVPTKSGAYCFALQFTSESGMAGRVAIEDFQVTAEHIIAKPFAAFSIPGIFEIGDSNMLTFPQQKVSVSNTSTNTDTCHWTLARPDGTTEESDDYAPSFNFDLWGAYTLTLEAENTSGKRTTSHTYKVMHIDDSYSDFGITTWNPNEDKLYDRVTGVPAFEEERAPNDTERDYITGFNRYYTAFAERFSVPAGNKTSIKSLLYTEAFYRICPDRNNSDAYKPFSIVIYNDINGRPDTRRVVARIETTVGEAFGYRTVSGSGGGDMLGVEFEEPITVDGSFYVAFEFDPTMTVTISDPNVGRSFLGLAAASHRSGISTLYCRPRALPEGSKATVGEWCRVEEVRDDMKGTGLYLILWTDLTPAQPDGIVSTAAEPTLAVCHDGDNLIIRGTVAGEEVSVTTADGRTIGQTVATGALTTLHIPATALPACYIVRCGDKSVRMLRK